MSIWLQPVFDAFPDHIAILDAEGKIIAVNQAWQRFAKNNGVKSNEAFVGKNYLAVCQATRGEDAPVARVCLQGLERILAGKQSEFSLEYPCHSSTEQRWFRLRAIPLQQGAVVIHSDISQLKQETQNTIKLQEVLLATTNELLTQEVTPEFYQRLLEQAVTLIPSAQAGSITVRKEDDRFYFVAAVGFDLQGLSKISFDENELFFSGRHLPVNKSYLVTGIDTINLKRLDAKRLRQLRKTGHIQRIAVTLGVPIYVGDHISATLSLDSFDDVNAFNQDDQHIAEALAAQIGLVLQHVQDKEALHKSEKLFSTLFHKSPTPTALFSLAEHRFLDANQSFLNFMGYTREDLLGKDALAFDFFSMDQHQRLEQLRAAQKTLSSDGTIALTEQPLHTKSGSIRTVNGLSTAVELNGQIAVLTTLNDITEQVRSQQVLHESEKRKSFLLNLSDTLRPLADAAHIQEAATRSAMNYFGADRCYYCEIENDKAIIRQDVSRSDLPSVVGVYPLSNFAIFKAMVDTGHPFVVPDVHTSKLMDNTLKQLYIQMKIISYLDVPVIKDGKPAGIFCITQSTPREWTNFEIDLAVETSERVWEAVERAKVETALRQSEVLFSTLFHQGLTPMILISIPDFYVMDANQSFLKLVGYETRDIMGKEILKLPFIIEPRARTAAQQLIRGDPLPLDEVHLSTKSGKVLTVLRTVAPIVVNGQRCALASLMDITERKRTEEQLTQAIQEVMKDAQWFSHSVMEKLAHMNSHQIDVTETTDLTEREHEVLALIAKGKDNTDIGKELDISPQTVRNYVSQIYSKLGIRSRAEAVVWARERGLVS